MLGLYANSTKRSNTLQLSPVTPPRTELPQPARAPVFMRSVFAGLVTAAAMAAMLTAVVLEIQAGASAYIIGEGHWSKAQQDTVYYLYRYSEHGDPRQLAMARAALRVPLGDRDARLALEQRPVDLKRARAGFIQGRNAPDDVGRMIRMFRYLSRAPYMRESIALWRDADLEIIKLQTVADEMEAVYARRTLDLAEARLLRERIGRIGSTVRPIEVAYSQSLLRGSRMLHRFLLIASAAIFLLIAGFSMAVLRGALRRVNESEGKFRAAFDQAAIGMLKLDNAGKILDANAALADILGYPTDALTGMHIAQLLHADERGDLVPDADGARWDQQGVPTDRRFLRRDGSTLWGRWTASVIRAAHDRRPDLIFAILEDASKARQLAAEFAHQASHDALTGLINRREIERRLEQSLQSAQLHGLRHALCFVDLDQFKLVNDTCGHAVGDLLLHQLAGTLAAQLHDGDWVGRLGGDEFAILLDRASRADAEHAAERISAQLAASAFLWQGRNYSITCSIGVVEINAQTPDVGWLLRAADAACYLAKDDGRNRVRVYQDSDEAITRRHSEMEWVGETQRAMAEGRLLLFAQRIVPSRGESSMMYEVLLRLIDAHGRLQLPALFLPAVERFGQAMAVDCHVLTLLLNQLAAHPEHLRQLELCHVNVSAQSIAIPEFRGFVLDLLAESRVPATKICFEITETAVISSLAVARTFIDAVRAQGCRVALDDFGSGLSSFAYLKHLSIDFLKIDGVFVREMDTDEIDFALVRSICELGRTLGKQTIAEWAESDAIVSRLRAVGVDYIQGFAIHQPCRLDELMRQSRNIPEAMICAAM
ncbi:MAG: EAL domain-containing protein [Pseudomonadota bacterium]|nr:EAL domain-containing protein [Pseudomonadota bacterium]